MFTGNVIFNSKKSQNNIDKKSKLIDNISVKNAKTQENKV